MKLFAIGLLVVVCSASAYLQLTTSPGVQDQSEQTKAIPRPSEQVPAETAFVGTDEIVEQREMTPEANEVVPTTTQSLRSLSASTIAPQPYREFVNPSAYLHTGDEPITIGEHIGKKIIMVSFMTYSCINCQRTFPTLVRLDEQYRDDGLLVIGIHTPEFAFEHDPSRVEEALAKYGITFPVVLDNKYETWNAYQNRFWPRRYIIDVTGNIVYDHIGEGDYEGAERVIKALLPTLPTV
jgi:thiol-disulfide isomerase/thioredoxin